MIISQYYQFLLQNSGLVSEWSLWRDVVMLSATCLLAGALPATSRAQSSPRAPLLLSSSPPLLLSLINQLTLSDRFSDDIFSIFWVKDKLWSSHTAHQPLYTQSLGSNWWSWAKLWRSPEMRDSTMCWLVLLSIDCRHANNKHTNIYV